MLLRPLDMKHLHHLEKIYTYCGELKLFEYITTTPSIFKEWSLSEEYYYLMIARTTLWY